ncbi:MAG TPA: hypothetical protein VFT17_06570 [Propionibacteriaceae bacterium]|nr:hypothetical protein [Propionibacteriaceae bacterium]
MIAAAVSAHETMGDVKIMFASLGAYGHLYPMMPLALACAAAGHETVSPSAAFSRTLATTKR